MREIIDFIAFLIGMPVVAFHYHPVASAIVAGVMFALAMVLAAILTRGEM